MNLLEYSPALTPQAAGEIARELYAVAAEATALPSERDQNFLLQTAAGERFVLKIANAAEPVAMLEAQNAVLAHLTPRTALCQRVLPARDGRTLVELPARFGGRHMVRLLTWLPGETLGSRRHHSSALLEDVGRKAAELDGVLADFDHPAIHREFYWDLARAFDVIRERSTLVTDEELRQLIERLTNRIEHQDAARLARLHRCAVHNDPNDYNVLVAGAGNLPLTDRRVVGILDFGDLVHSYAIADVAIAGTYAALDKPHPLDALVSVVRGYNAARPLNDEEISAVFPLVLLRLCTSVAVAAQQQTERPGDTYLAISQAPIRRTLPRLARLHPAFAEAALRWACGKAPRPATSRVRAWLGDTFRQPASLLGRDVRLAVSLDLSVGSALVSGDARDNEEPKLASRIQEAMANASGDAGIGRYGEARVLYSSPLFAGDGGEHGERRTVHLGIDVFSSAGTPVHAPFDAVVHTIADNRAPLDYGPVVILKHETDAGDAFYTLYGHLSRASIQDLKPSTVVKAGQRFACLGTADENGGWPPHVHVQLILDLLDLANDFPGVCRASEREIWSAFSPDPAPILRIGRWAESGAHGHKPEIRATRQQYIGSSLQVGYSDPVNAVRGWMQYLFDETGRQYLDAYNNVPHVGHCHPRVVRAAADQMRVLNTNTRYLHESLGRYAERLSQTLPEPLRVCFFVNSGSEANELALRLARVHTHHHGIVVLDAAYHGNTTSLVSISPYKFNGPGGEGRPSWVRTVPIPDVYRGPFKNEAGQEYAAFVSRALENLEHGDAGVAAFIAESAPSVGGQIILPDGYLGAVYQAVRSKGGVCIADEVQTAFGRLGTCFYAFEAQRVIPDIVVLGKPIGNGHPIGAVVTTPAIARSFDNGMEFFSTFGGNTVSCAVGLAVLDVVMEERLQEHARLVGMELMTGLQDLASKHPLIGDVRGSGLFIGVELVRSRETLEPATSEARAVVNRLREEGILLGTDGPFANVLKIRPPMPFTAADGARLCETLGAVLGELA
jgi:4-aminobutyrate aminotransferase-like enzyme/Ser/Thr protein kinase RdoA (MazF antagonist)